MSAPLTSNADSPKLERHLGLLQAIGQIIALHILRKTRPDVPLPFRMWLYPIPSLLGWIFLWVNSGWTPILSGVGIIASGCVVFLIWRGLDKETHA